MTSKSEDLLSTWSTLFVTHALSIQRVEESIAGRAPLTLHEYDILLTVRSAPDQRMRYGDLTTRSLFSKSGVTRVAKRLEVRGFIERVKCELDGRGAYVALTKEGVKALKETWALYSKAVLNLYEPALSQSEAITLEKLLSKILGQLRPEPLITISSKKTKTCAP